MNRIGFVLILLLLSLTVSAQDIDKCRNIVAVTTRAIDAKETTELEKHLSPNFEIAKISGKLAITVLKQLISQLDETVISSTEIKSTKKGNQLFLTYVIEYSKMGKKEATFVFDEQSKLQQLELFKMEVLTKEKTKVEASTQNVITIPFKLVGSLILVEVEVDDQKLDFILDSGSPSVVLNAKYYQEEDSIFQHQRKLTSAKGINGSVSDMSFVEVEHLDFGGLKITNQKIISMNLTSLEKECDAKIYGLIGYEMFKEFDVLYDYQAKQITFIKPDYFSVFQAQELQSNVLTVTPFELEKHIPIVKVKIKDKEYRMGIDCGAEVNLLDDDLFCAVKKSLRRITTDNLIGVNGESAEVVKAKLKSLFIGHQKFKNTKFVFSDMAHFNSGYKLMLDGLIGYEILAKQKTLISYARKEMVLIK